MYKKINISEITLQILSLFTSKEKTIHIREASKLCRCSPRSAQIALEQLEKKGVLSAQKKGNMKLFNIQNNTIAKQYLQFSLQHQTLCFFEEEQYIQEIIHHIKQHSRGIGILFGSRVKKTNKKNSDIDVFVAGSANTKEIQKISKLYNIEIDVKIYSKKEFEKFTKKGEKDFLIEEIKKDHIVFSEIENYVEHIFYEKNPVV
ncbi:MAG: nucleotidyltransferase domain-containing protein [Candidatus Woesearchaeota archaeon]